MSSPSPLTSDSEDEQDQADPPVKRVKGSGTEGAPRVYATTTQRREQNRLHARNTRERKKQMLDRSVNKINQLLLERARLAAYMAERTGEIIPPFVPTKLASAEQYNNEQLQEIDNEMRKIEEMQEKNGDKQTAEQLWNTRKEKNRIHARKTRLRKKIALDEAEHTLGQLAEETNILRSRVFELVDNRGCVSSQLMPFPPGQPTNFSSNIYNPMEHVSPNVNMYGHPPFGVIPPFGPNMNLQSNGMSVMCLPWHYSSNQAGDFGMNPQDAFPHFSHAMQAPVMHSHSMHFNHNPISMQQMQFFHNARNLSQGENLSNMSLPRQAIPTENTVPQECNLFQLLKSHVSKSETAVCKNLPQEPLPTENVQEVSR